MEDNLKKNLFNEFIEGAVEVSPKKEPLKVFLRIRPFLAEELVKNEDQDCILVKDGKTIELNPPKDSFTFKSAARSTQTHEFKFTKVFEKDTSQKEFFDSTMLPFVKDILDGQNGLCFTYGVTNSGKTYTIQGTPKDGGIVPRALDVFFNSIGKKLYTRANIKPKHCHEVTILNKEDESKEEMTKASILYAGQKENNYFNSTCQSDRSISMIVPDLSMIQKSSRSYDASDIAEELKSRVADGTTVNIESKDTVKFAIWVSFMEIYNEQMFDLLDLTPLGKGRRRPILKLGDDKDKNPYVKGLKEIFVTTADEAYAILRLGQKNQHISSTKLNQQSSRSHSIFTIKVLKIVDNDQPHVVRISRFSIVDLAGSERYCKTGTAGDRLKEASNINCSMMTLGKCINTLRNNQENPNNPIIVPFRESKLTRLFQSFFRGKGKASMIVNISQCASVFDETLNVMKFSAVAQQIKMKAQRATELWKVPPLPKVIATPARRPPLTIVMSTTKKRSLEDPSQYSYDELVSIVGELRDKVKFERREKSMMESSIRKEVCEEMNKIVEEMEEDHTNQLREQRLIAETTMEKRIDLLTKVANKACKRQRTEDEDGEKTVPYVILHAEKMKNEELVTQNASLNMKLKQLQAENKFVNQINSKEDFTDTMNQLRDELSQVKQARNLQNDEIERMQLKLQEKDDELDLLKELVQEMQSSQKDSPPDVITKEENVELLKLSTQFEEWYKIEKEKNRQLAGDVKSLGEELNIKEKEKNNLKVENNDLTEKLKDIDEQWRNTQFENDEFTIKLDRYEKLNKDLQSALRENEEIIEDLNKKLRDTQAQYEHVHQEDQSHTKNELEKVSAELLKAESQVKEYSEKIVRLENQLKLHEDNNQTNAICEKETPRKKAFENLKGTPVLKGTPTLKSTPTMSPYTPKNQSMIKNLEKRLEEANKALEKKAATIVQKTNKINSLEQRIQTLEKKSNLNEIMKEKERAENQNFNLTAQLRDLETLKLEIDGNYAKEIEISKSLKTELNDWMKKFNDLQSEYTDLFERTTSEIQKYENEKEKIQEECQLKDLNISKLHDQLVDYESEKRSKAELLQQLNRANERLNELSESQEKLQKELTDIKARNVDLMGEVQNLTNEINLSTETSETLRKKLSDRRKSRLAQDENLTQTIDGMNERINKLNIQINDLSEENCMLEQETFSKGERIKSLTEDLGNLNNVKNEMVEENRSIKSQLDSETSQHKGLLLEMETVKAKCMKYEIRVASLESELGSKQVEIDNEQEKYVSLNDKFIEECNKISSAQKYIERLEVDKKENSLKILELESELVEVEKNYNEKETALSELEASNTKLSQELKKIKLECELAEEELKKSKSQSSDSTSDDNVKTPSSSRKRKQPLSTSKRVTRGMRSLVENEEVPEETNRSTKRYPKRRKNLAAAGGGDDTTFDSSEWSRDNGASKHETLPPVEECSLVASVSIALSPMTFAEATTTEENTVFEERVTVKIGDFVALHSSSERKETPPVLGKVINVVSESVVELEMWQGSYTKVWKVKRNEDDGIAREIINIEDILLADIHLTNSNRLPAEFKRRLQKLYT